jgi:hypothetical protein
VALLKERVTLENKTVCFTKTLPNKRFQSATFLTKSDKPISKGILGVLRRLKLKL